MGPWGQGVVVALEVHGRQVVTVVGEVVAEGVGDTLTQRGRELSGRPVVRTLLISRPKNKGRTSTDTIK